MNPALLLLVVFTCICTLFEVAGFGLVLAETLPLSKAKYALMVIPTFPLVLAVLELLLFARVRHSLASFM